MPIPPPGHWMENYNTLLKTVNAVIKAACADFLLMDGKKKLAQRRRGKRKTLGLRVLARGKGENKEVKCACQQLFRARIKAEKLTLLLLRKFTQLYGLMRLLDLLPLYL